MLYNKLPPWWIYKALFHAIRFVERLRRKIWPPQLKLMDLCAGHIRTQVIHAGVQLGLFDILADKPLDLESLAAKSKTNEEALYRLLRALFSMGFVTKDADAKYNLTKTGELLTSKTPSGYQAQVTMMSTTWYEGALKLPDAVRTGKKALDPKFGGDFFHYLEKDPLLVSTFNKNMREMTLPFIPALLAEYDFSMANHIVDVGGGYGDLLFAILEAYPHIHGTLFDTQKVIQGLEKSNSIGSRCKIVGGNFLEEVPEGGDIYLLKFIIHDWDDANAMKILANCRKVMKKGDRILLVEATIQDTEYNWFRLYLDILLLTMFDGKERTVSQFKELLEKSGFTFKRTIPTRSLLTIIEAECSA